MSLIMHINQWVFIWINTKPRWIWSFNTCWAFCLYINSDQCISSHKPKCTTQPERTHVWHNHLSNEFKKKWQGNIMTWNQGFWHETSNIQAKLQFCILINSFFILSNSLDSLIIHKKGSRISHTLIMANPNIEDHSSDGTFTAEHCKYLTQNNIGWMQIFMPSYL